jgi:circadian clock protein KaiC
MATAMIVDAPSRELAKAATGIQGLDEVTGGGLPRGRPTLISGTAGCGKTLFSMEFLVRGITQFNEPGVFMAFEERAEELTENFRSLGFDLDELVQHQRLVLDYVHLDRSEIDETGEYDLEGLFIRLGHAIDSIGAKRVVLDTIETLFGGLSNHAILRSELRRLFRFLKDKGVTAVITCERGDGTITRHGLEEYVSDCVILLDHRVDEQLSTRRLRIVKYRGSAHGTDEYPFLIDETGINVLPITSVGLNHPAPEERVSTGVAGLDEMLESKGYYRGSTILVSGTAGTGKTTIAAHFAHAAAARGERVLYIALEESPRQLTRNMRSVGVDYQPWVDQGILHFHATRPTRHGLEMHLATIHKLVNEFQPAVVVMDPISNLVRGQHIDAATSMLLRLIDFLKGRGITTLFTNLTAADGSAEQTEVGVSSLVDTWLLLREVESDGERNRGLYILKSRGMSHSNQIREFVLAKTGIQLREVYIGANGVLTGSARLAQEAKEQAAAHGRREAIERKRRRLERKRKAVENRVAALQATYEADEEEMQRLVEETQTADARLQQDRATIAHKRGSGNSRAAAKKRGDR